MQLVSGVDGGGYLLVQQGHDLIHQGKLVLLTLGFWQGGQSCFTELAQVAGQALRGFGGVEGLEVVE